MSIVFQPNEREPDRKYQMSDKRWLTVALPAVSGVSSCVGAGDLAVNVCVVGRREGPQIRAGATGGGIEQLTANCILVNAAGSYLQRGPI